MFKKGSYIYYGLGNGLFYFAWAMFACMISIFLSDNGQSATEISLISSAAALFGIILQPITGMLADKLKSPKTIAIGASLCSIITGLLFAYTQSYLSLFLFNGFTQGILNGITALTDRLALSSDYRFGTIRIWGSVLYAVGAQLSGFTYETISPQANYIIFASAMVLMIFCFINMNDAKPKESTGIIEETYGPFENIKQLFSNKSFVSFCIIFLLFNGASSGQWTYFPIFVKELGGSATLIGTTLFLSTLSEIPAVLYSDRIFKKISYKTMMVFACFLAMIRFLWYSTNPDPKAIMMIFFFQGLTSILFILIAVHIITEIVDEHTINTAYGISSMLARGIAPLVFQVLAGNILDAMPGLTGFTFTYYIYAGTMLLCIFLAARFKMPEKIKDR